MNIFQNVKALVDRTVSNIIDDPDMEKVAVESPKIPEHGDVATNAAMVLTKQAGMKPRDLAEKIVAGLLKDEIVKSAEIAGPGFINIRLTDATWHGVLQSILLTGKNYGKSNAGEDRRVQIEFCSANPSGPLHIGHCRGTVFGDALANLLKFTGHEVETEYYVNDAGNQIEKLVDSVILRYREALGEDIGEFPDDLYPGDYLKPVGEQLKSEHGDSLLQMPDSEKRNLINGVAVNAMLDMIKADLAGIRVEHDRFFSEKSLYQKDDTGKTAVDRTIQYLKDSNFAYVGTLPPPKGKETDDWKPQEQLLFRASDFGDEMDRALLKADGGMTYFASDVAYFKDKADRGYDETVYVLGADHSGYAKRLEGVAAAIGNGKVNLVPVFCQLVKLFKDGQELKMSKRDGTYVTVREVVDEVGADAVRYMMLHQKINSVLSFDFQKVVEMSRDNPVFYCQYAHARCCSLFRQWEQDDVDVVGTDMTLLQNNGELKLIRKLAEWPNIVQGASDSREPHRICNYLYDLASEFHALWNHGNDDPGLRFVVDDPDLTRSRMALAKAIRNVLRIGLELISVSAPDEMRG